MLKRPAVLLGCMALSLAALEVGKQPPLLKLDGDQGGLVSGEAWSSTSLQGKVHILFYVDPDEKGMNEHVEKALKEALKPYDAKQRGSIAIVNMAATWKPNFVISAILKNKQKKYPNTVYVRDYSKVFVDQWGLTDDSYHIAVFDTAGRTLYSKSGALSEQEVKALIDLVKDAIEANK